MLGTSADPFGRATDRNLLLMRRIIVTLAILVVSTAAAFAQDHVDLELVLLADATGSIDDAEIRFQRDGYAEAITDPAVLSAISGTLQGRIAVTYVEWGSAAMQDVVVDWMVIDGAETAARFADALRLAPRRAFGRNAIGAALLLAKKRIDENAISGTRRVVDISADSANNWSGPEIETARDTVVASGISINGLAVLCRYCSGRPVSYDLEAAFEARIIGGPGAFVITADSAETFAAAVRRKLILEIAGNCETGKSIPCDSGKGFAEYAAGELQ
jgi:Protein of unknown function (DUF1194)